MLDRVCPSLCDAALGVSGSAAKLDLLGRSNLFLVPLDAEREWYRSHRMLRDLLRRQVAERDPAAIAGLHGRAADWFEAHDDRESALEHASQAGDLDRVAALTSALAMAVYHDGRIATVERWLERFEDDGILERYPEVAVHGARVHALGGRADESDRWLAAAEAAPGNPARRAGHRPGGSRSCAPRPAATASSRCWRRGTGTGRSPRPERMAAGALLLRGAAHAFTGDREGADRDFADASRAADRLATPGHGTRGRRAFAARRRHRRPRPGTGAPAPPAASSTSECEAGLSTAAIHLAATARAELRLGRWDDARALLARAQHLTPLLTDAIPWLAVQARLELARAYVTLRDAAAARALLAEVDDVLERRPALGSLVEDVADFRAQVAAIPSSIPAVRRD